MGREFEARWLRYDEPKPEGWEYAANEHRMRDHHRHYAVMIVREIKTTDTDGANDETLGTKTL